MNILYFITGDSINCHMQVCFSIRSILAQMSQDDTIYVLTDTPRLYQDLPQVVTIFIDETKIQEWKGIHNFFWRIKIKAIEYIAQKDPNHSLMYLDGDTCLSGKLADIKSLLKQSTGLMHFNEGHPSSRREGEAGNTMWQQVKNKAYAGIKLSSKHFMYNAGMIAIPKNHLEDIIPLTLRLCDEMINDGVLPVLVEQYSFSIALIEKYTKITEGNKYIIHYWHNKSEWSNYIGSFFAKSYIQKLSLEDELNVIRKTNFRYLQRKLEIKRIIKKHILMQKI